MVHLMHSKVFVVKVSIWIWDHLGMGTKLRSIIEIKVMLSTSNVLRNSKLEMCMSNEPPSSLICLVVGKVDGMSKSKMMLNLYQILTICCLSKGNFDMVMSISLSMSCSVSLLKKLEDFILNTSRLPWGANLGSFGWIVPFIRHSVCEKCSLSWQTMLVHKTLVGVQKRIVGSKMGLDVGKTKMYRVEAMSVMLGVVWAAISCLVHGWKKVAKVVNIWSNQVARPKAVNLEVRVVA